MNINGKTRLIGLMGNPVEHTLSPLIHNGISERLQQNSVYMPFHVENEGLDKAVLGAIELNILGLNVTVPHKNNVIKSLSEIDESASKIGAVNTLVRTADQKGYKGYNTDMLGLQRQIKEDGVNLNNSTVVILGAGGAAKAVVYMCLLEGAKKIYLLNRTVPKAEQIAKDMMSDIIVPMQLSDYNEIVEDDLIVFQATSIGLAPNVEDVVVDSEAFYQKIKVGIDLIYNPADTKFMQLVRKNGGQAYNALKMLLYQGVIAYELWHNLTVPQEVIDEVYVELKRAVYPKDNIVLIGFMGSGKSTVGSVIAKAKGMNFLDTDEFIEQKAGKSIPQIFEEDGEEAFRKIETEVLIYLRDNLKNTILSTGGGMPLRKENANLLKEIGQVHYLTASNQVIYDRVKDSTNRPLLNCEDPYGKICELMKIRQPLYKAAADHIIDTNCNDIEDVCEQIYSANEH